MNKTVLTMVAAGFSVLALMAGAHAQEKVRVGLAVPNNSPYSPAFAAAELGYFKAAGLDVEITEYRGGSAAQEALIAGAADMITYLAPGVGLAVSSGAKEKIVGAILDVPYGWHIIVPANSKVQSVADLDGKRLGITGKGSSTDLLGLWALDKAGVKAMTIPLGAGVIPALRSGQVEAVVIYPPVGVEMIKSGQARSIMDFAKTMPPILPDVWVASQRMIDERPTQLKATLAAFYKAVQYMQANSDWSREFLKKKMKIDDAAAALGFELVAQNPRSGKMQEAWVKDSLAIAAKVWDKPNLLDLAPNLIFTNDFLPDAH